MQDDRRRQRKPGIFKSWGDLFVKLIGPVAVGLMLWLVFFRWLGWV